jgi:hypothetical protein
VLNIRSHFMGTFYGVAASLGCPEQSVKAVLHAREVQGSAEIWGRFGGGSARNRALVGGSCNAVHFMQIAQSRINTGDCASR